MNELLLAHEKKKNEKKNFNNHNENNNTEKITDKDDSIIFTNINNIKKQYEKVGIEDKQS